MKNSFITEICLLPGFQYQLRNNLITNNSDYADLETT